LRDPKTLCFKATSDNYFATSEEDFSKMVHMRSHSSLRLTTEAPTSPVQTHDAPQATHQSRITKWEAQHVIKEIAEEDREVLRNKVSVADERGLKY
jgi:hypothetical protein